MPRNKKSISNWNNFPKIEAEEYSVNYQADAIKIIQNTDHSIIGRGNGRCYGDASLAKQVISTLKHNCILFFDTQNGIIECEAGILFKNLVDFLVPKGWFLPVTPGTKYITLGGAVASDVHGKNHHKEGSFSKHVLSFSIMIESGEILEVSSETYSDLFSATMGGMGLTGLILSVRFRLKKIESAYITQQQVQAKNLDHVIDLFTEYKNSTYTMAWIDCLAKGKNQGRSIMYAGEHSQIAELPKKKHDQPLSIPSKRKISVPVNLPSFALNRFSVSVFNQFYYTTHPSKRNQIIDYDSFFYPLDSLLEWNKMYGKKGFIQYQFVIPLADNAAGLKKILDKISQKGWGSFLAVLKLFGPQDSIISFPMEGLTLALDFPIKKGLFDFLDELDKIVEAHGGRIYLSKDARMQKETFEATYPNYNRFIQTIEKFNPNKKFNSHLSKRIVY
ncbi:FAD/FMN-containing dehydrogenase [Marivirga sericea]|uniref:FAD/FMN-containing dehydrogenase n=1 Tax=Marivirga sericea TaxID=1028 RepID=A0A1X7KLF4_9BACT|nr:FAD-binding oxidoreductase [Marivirga sericea]SMG41867.1 FAD/FMN-containing dehydrogenase [Marivirga sericea]